MADTTCEMDALNDDELLLVLQYVDADDLLRCREVCRRLRDLALHPDVWRSRSIFLNERSRPLLRLAPCARSLQLQNVMHPEKNFAEFKHNLVAAARARCAVAELHMFIDDVFSDILTDIILNQSMLGRLKKLDVILLQTSWPGERLTNTIFAARRLSELTIHITSGPVSSNVVIKPYEATLRKIKINDCMSETVSENTVNLLHGHAATLEEVELSFGIFYCYFDCEHLVDALIKIPNLKKLICPPTSGFDRLKQCTLLTDLNIYFTDLKHAKSVEPFLRDNTQLTHVGINCDSSLKWECLFEVEEKVEKCHHILILLSALFESGKSNVTSLQLVPNTLGLHAPPFYEQLISILAESKLECLDLKFRIDVSELKKILTRLPTTTPRLTRLRFGLEGCVHYWLHDKSFRDMFLHKELKSVLLYPNTCINDKTKLEFFSCEFCKLGCHRTLTNMTSGVFDLRFFGINEAETLLCADQC